MIEAYPAPDHVAAFRISGTLDGEEYDRVIAGIRDKLARHERIGVLVDLTDFGDFTAEAFWKDAKFSIGFIGKLWRFPREAVISDKKWVHTLARVADPLVPSVEIRAFTSDQRDAALAWVADLPPPR